MAFRRCVSWYVFSELHGYGILRHNPHNCALSWTGHELSSYAHPDRTYCQIAVCIKCTVPFSWIYPWKFHSKVLHFLAILFCNQIICVQHFFYKKIRMQFYLKTSCKMHLTRKDKVYDDSLSLRACHNVVKISFLLKLRRPSTNT